MLLEIPLQCIGYLVHYASLNHCHMGRSMVLQYSQYSPLITHGSNLQCSENCISVCSVNMCTECFPRITALIHSIFSHGGPVSRWPRLAPLGRQAERETSRQTYAVRQSGVFEWVAEQREQLLTSPTVRRSYAQGHRALLFSL